MLSHYTETSDAKSDTKNHFIASALSGLAFYLYPNTSIFGHIAITIVEIFWKLNKPTLRQKCPWLPIDAVSMNIVTFPIAFSIMNHVRAFTPWLAPSMLKKIMSLSTNYKWVPAIEFCLNTFWIYIGGQWSLPHYRDEDIYTRFYAALFGLERQFIIWYFISKNPAVLLLYHKIYSIDNIHNITATTAIHRLDLKAFEPS